MAKYAQINDAQQKLSLKWNKVTLSKIEGVPMPKLIDVNILIRSVKIAFFQNFMWLIAEETAE